MSENHVSLSKALRCAALAFGLMAAANALGGGAPGNGKDKSAAGFDAETQTRKSQELAKAQADPKSSTWQAKGDQRRSYRFDEAAETIKYRIYVPTTWDGKSKLPMVVMLHGAGANENTYLDQNNKLLPKLAEKHGYLLVSPLGYSAMGAYGSYLRLPAVFGQPEAAAKQRAAVDEAKRRTLDLSEKDVINVIEIVANEYPIDRKAMFLMGHSMGSGGTWYLGARYDKYWAALAPMSGPFVDETTYPWDHIRDKPIFMTEGTAPPVS